MPKRVHDPYKSERNTFSRAALALLAYAARAAELADQVAALVPVSPTPQMGGMDLVNTTVVLGMCEELMTAAVVYERERGAHWQDIGRHLGRISAGEAEERYDDAWQRWRAGVKAPTCSYFAPPYGTHPDVPEAVYDPVRTARKLDEWVHERGLRPDEPHPVSGSLPALKTTEEADRIMCDIRYAAMGDVDPEYLAGLYEEKAEIYGRLGVELRSEFHFREEIALALARARELRRQIADLPDSRVDEGLTSAGETGVGAVG